MAKTNSVVRISYAVGLLGLLFGSVRGKTAHVIREHNLDGWNIAFVIPDNPNLMIWILRLLLLVVTLGLWTISTGYLLIFEKEL